MLPCGLDDCFPVVEAQRHELPGRVTLGAHGCSRLLLRCPDPCLLSRPGSADRVSDSLNAYAIRQTTQEESSMNAKRWICGITFLVLLLGSGFSSSAAPQRGWDYLGEANVDGGSDHDKIDVDKDRVYKALQIRVERAAIEFYRIKVNFRNGTNQEIPIKHKVPAGGKSRVIDLRGGERSIKNVEIWYGRGNWANSAKPKLRLFGLT